MFTSMKMFQLDGVHLEGLIILCCGSIDHFHQDLYEYQSCQRQQSQLLVIFISLVPALICPTGCSSGGLSRRSSDRTPSRKSVAWSEVSWDAAASGINHPSESRSRCCVISLLRCGLWLLQVGYASCFFTRQSNHNGHELVCGESGISEVQR